MGINRLQLAREWMVKAQHDLTAARILAASASPVCDVAIYHCQQAAEKAAKGYLVFRDVAFEKTHDVRFVVLKAADVDSSFNALLDDARLLTPYAHAFRYPDEVMDPSPEQVANALAAADRIFRFILSKVSQLAPDAA